MSQDVPNDREFQTERQNAGRPGRRSLPSLDAALDAFRERMSLPEFGFPSSVMRPIIGQPPRSGRSAVSEFVYFDVSNEGLERPPGYYESIYTAVDNINSDALYRTFSDPTISYAEALEEVRRRLMEYGRRPETTYIPTTGQTTAADPPVIDTGRLRRTYDLTTGLTHETREYLRDRWDIPDEPPEHTRSRCTDRPPMTDAQKLKALREDKVRLEREVRDLTKERDELLQRVALAEGLAGYSNDDSPCLGGDRATR